MSAHTPGPWFICEHNTGGETGDDLDIEIRPGGWFLRVSPGYPINSTHFPYPDEVRTEFAANARLTAAGPELLEALTGLMDAYSYYFKPGNPWGDKARAAIAKATTP